MTIEKYIELNYPLCELCVNCEYWRYLNNSFGHASGSYYIINTGGKSSLYSRTPLVGCHYAFDNDKLKPEDAHKPDGTCSCYAPRTRQHITKNRGKLVKWGNNY